MLNTEKIKNDFQIFKNNSDLVYLDSAATSLTPDSVVYEMNDYYFNYRSSTNRGSSKIGGIATKKYEHSRKKISSFFNANFDEVIFTRSTTSGINSIARILETSLTKGDEIIVSDIEHHANLLPWQELVKKTGAKLVYANYNKQLGQLTVDEVISKVTVKTKIIALHHVSNVLGDCVDIKTICKYARDHNIMTVIDGAQAVAHVKVDFHKIGCDFYVFSSHKMLGPTGLGIILIKEKNIKQLPPSEYGGDMVTPSSVDYDHFQVKNNHLKFEAGTPAIAEVIGFGKSIEYLEQFSFSDIHNHEYELKKYAVKLLREENCVDIYNENLENGMLVFNIKNVNVHDAMSESMINDECFSSANIALRDGQHCNNLTMKYILQVPATLRVSFYLYNTKEDVEKLVKQTKKIYDAFNKEL